MKRAIILSGGPAHDYATTSAMLAEVLGEGAISATIHEDLAVLGQPAAKRADLIVANCARWTCDQTPDWRAEWHFELPEEAREGLLGFLLDGGPLLALHAAPICFDDWPEWPRILGATWRWGCSGHAPLQEFTVRMAPVPHPITDGLSDFPIVDELYTNLDPTDTIEPLATAEWEDVRHPLLWVRRFRDARVCYNALGHGLEAFANPTFRTLILRGAQWAVGAI